MIKKALSLALAVYRVTKLFPGGEVLIGQLRATANKIISEITCHHQAEAVLQIKVLLNYLQMAKIQGWTKEVNFDILKREYSHLLNELSIQIEQDDKEPVSLKKEKITKLEPREKKILKHIKDYNQFQARDLTKYFPNSSRRTLNRDLEKMCLDGYLKKIGQGRSCFYKKRDINATYKMSRLCRNNK